MKMPFVTIVAFIFPLFVTAQAFQIDKAPLPIDSLKKALPLLRDSARVDCLNELCRSHTEALTFAHIDTALSLAQQVYTESSAMNYIKGLGDACLRYGVINHWYFFNADTMEKYYKEAISWYNKIQDDDRLGRAYMGLGHAFRLQSFPDKANAAFAQAAVHFKRTGNRVMLAELIDCFGLVYQAKGDFEKWFEYIKKGLREKKKINDSRGLVTSFYRLAHIYQAVGDFETALDYFHQSFALARSQSMRWNMYNSMGYIFFNLKNYDSAFYYFRKMTQIAPIHAGAIIGMGKISLLRNEHDKAFKFFQEALTIFKKTDNLRGQAEVLGEIGKTYCKMKQYGPALRYARESLAIARQINWKEAMQYAYEIHWNVYEALQQEDSAYFHYRKFVNLKDSLVAAQLKLQYLQKLALYKAETKEEQQQARIDLLNKDNQIKQQQLQEESLQKKLLAGSLATLVLLGIVFFRNIALKRRNEKHRRELAENELQIQKLESEKTRAELQQQATLLEMQALRAQMNPHFIFNCLSSINRFILKNETEAASDYLTKFSRLIRMVLNNSKETLITLEDELEMLRLYMDMERLRFKNAFDYSITFTNAIEFNNVFVPPLLLQPFVENAIWHGLMHKQGQGHLEISLTAEQKTLNCIITDNGIGRSKAALMKSKSVDKQRSMGLKITTERLALLNRDMEGQTFFKIEDLTDKEGNAAGTRVILKLHYKDMAEAFI